MVRTYLGMRCLFCPPEGFAIAVYFICFRTCFCVLRILAHLNLVCRHFLQAGQSAVFTVLQESQLVTFWAFSAQAQLAALQKTLQLSWAVNQIVPWIVDSRLGVVSFFALARHFVRHRWHLFKSNLIWVGSSASGIKISIKFDDVLTK